MPSLNQPTGVPNWIDRVRKDPFGPVGATSLETLHSYVEGVFGNAHILGTDYSFHAGEHNQPEVPRDVGNVYYPAGAAIEVAKYANFLTHPFTGEIDLTFGGFTFPTLWDPPQISVQATSMSENGINKPCIVGVQVVSGIDIRFYSHFLSSALGGNATWAADDAAFAWAIHGTPRSQRAGMQLPGAWSRGEGLRFVEYNQQMRAASDLYANLGQGHVQSTGAHNTRVVPKAYAHVVWNGGVSYAKVEQDPNNHVASITRVGQGHVQMNFATAWALPMQPFFCVDYPRSSGGVANKHWNIVAPRSLQTTTRCELYIYSYDVAGNAWNRDDTDFWVVVHGG